MSATLGLLAVQGALGALDTLYFHEWRARLPSHPEMRGELGLHAARSGIYGLVFCTLPWIAWTGDAAVVLALLLAIEAVITFSDFVVEDRVRTSLGGVYAGERIMHGLMAIVYGALMTTFLPALYGWFTGVGKALGSGEPVVLLGILTALGLGALLSGLRDALAARRHWLGRRPGLPGPVHRPAAATRTRGAMTVALAGVVLLAAIVRRSP